jgi:hypothetical protein
MYGLRWLTVDYQFPSHVIFSQRCDGSTICPTMRQPYDFPTIHVVRDVTLEPRECSETTFEQASSVLRGNSHSYENIVELRVRDGRLKIDFLDKKKRSY